MSELTVHSVCTKGPIYPTLLYFQNGCPTKYFETNCAVLQDKNKSRTIVMETSELVYAGNEEKEDSGKILILARDRISGNVRLIEVGSADLKPLTETDLDHLEQQLEAKSKHSKMGSKKTKTQNISNAAQRDTGQIVESNNTIGEVDIPPIDREITKDELDCLQQQHKKSRLEFLEFEKKQLEQREKLRINLETVTESEPTEMEVMEQQDLTALEDNCSEEFHIPPINRGATKVEDVYHIENILSKDEKERNINEDSAPIRKPTPHKFDKKFVQPKDYNEIDPDEFYVPFLNREATNLEDVYDIKKIFSEDEYFQIFFELGENNYMDDLHPYIQQLVKNKTLSLEFTVLAVYASVLIKFLDVRSYEIKKDNSKIFHHSKTLRAILLKRFTEHVQCKRSRAMRSKVVCHIMVCTLILNNFQFEMDSLSDAIKWKKNQISLPKFVSFVAATIEIGDNGTMVKLKLPLVPKTGANRSRKYAQKITQNLKQKRRKRRTRGGREEAETDKIDPDDFYLPTIDREATKVEHVYPVEEILSQNEYETIYYELQQNNFKDDLHPYIQYVIENKTLSLQLTVLAAYANELLKFLEACKKIRNKRSRITRLFKKLNDIFIKRFVDETKIVKRKSYDMKDKMVCHIIVCLLILNDFRFKLEDFCNAIKKTYKKNDVEKAVSLVGAVIVIGDEGALVELKLPLVPKKGDIIYKTSKHITVDQDLTEYYENMKDTDDIMDPDDFFVPPINRQATELENVYLMDIIFSKSNYKKIYCELEKSNYSEDLHPYIQSIIENKSLSLQFTVLAVYASELIKFIHFPSKQLRKIDFKICHLSKTLNDILMKGFTEFTEHKCGRNSKYLFKCRTRSVHMKGKMLCHVIVCVLILNNFQFNLDPLSDAVTNKNDMKHNKVQDMVRLVGASIVDGVNGKMVHLKLPFSPRNSDYQKKTIRKTAILSKRKKNR